MMKLNFKSLFYMAILLFSANIYAQERIPENSLKTALTEIFDLSKKQDFSSLAKKMLFTENNESRTYNFSDKSEEKEVKRMAKRIKAYLDLSDSYTYESMSFSTFKKMQQAELKVNFKSGDQDLTISFFFVSKDGSILLQDIK